MSDLGPREPKGAVPPGLRSEERSDERRGKAVPSERPEASGAETRPRDVSEASGAEVRLAEAEDQRLRALAEAENVRKRCAAQVSRAHEQASAAVAAQWLPVVDNLDRALSHSQAEPGAIIDGVKAVRDQALDVLARLGFARRDDTGQRFDPALHEAIAARPAPETESGTVLEVVRAGYGERDHQLRPAQVVVAQAGPAAASRAE